MKKEARLAIACAETQLYQRKGNYEIVIALCSQWEAEGWNLWQAYSRLGAAYGAMGNYEKALEYVTLAYDRDPGNDTKARQAYFHGMLGNRKQANMLLNQLKQTVGYVSPYYLAWVYVGLEDYDPALVELRKAVYEYKCILLVMGSIYGLIHDYHWRPLHHRADFQALAREVYPDEIVNRWLQEQGLLRLTEGQPVDLASDGASSQ